MSCVVVVIPALKTVWPILSPAVTAAATSLGYDIAPLNARLARKGSNWVDLNLEASDIATGAGAAHSIALHRDGVHAIFTRDSRGKLKLRVTGAKLTRPELTQIGRQLIDRVTQQYVYHRVVSELKQRNMTIVDEELRPDRTVRIRVRNIE